MPTWISKEGIWEPAKERVVDPNAPQGQEIYEGPDRAAKEVLDAEKVETLGQHYSLDPELVMRARQLGFKDVDDYLKYLNYNKEKAMKRYQENKEKVETHKDPVRSKPAEIRGGGINTVPGANPSTHRFGGMEHPADAPATMAKPNS